MTLALVIGAGPAGLMAAEALMAPGRQVVVVDAMPTPARKFLMAGKSGLNLTRDEPLSAFGAQIAQQGAPAQLKDGKVHGATLAQLPCRGGARGFAGYSHHMAPMSCTKMG